MNGPMGIWDSETLTTILPSFKEMPSYSSPSVMMRLVFVAVLRQFCKKY